MSRKKNGNGNGHEPAFVWVEIRSQNKQRTIAENGHSEPEVTDAPMKWRTTALKLYFLMMFLVTMTTMYLH